MLIPHQLGLSKKQPLMLMRGGAVLVPHSNMGADKGEYVMMLEPQNARKLLTAYKKGKGIKIKLTPNEITQTLRHGRGFMDKVKKAFAKGKELMNDLLDNPAIKELGKQGIKKGAELVGTAIGGYFGNAELGKNVGKFVGEAGASGLEGRDFNITKNELANEVKKQGLDYARREGRRAIRENIDDPIYKQAAKESLNLADRRISATTGAEDLKRLGLGMKRPKLVKGSQEAKDYMASIRAKKGAGVGDFFKKVGRYVIPATTGTLGGLAGGAATGGNPAGAIAGSAAGSYAGNQLVKKLGIEGAGMMAVRGRGRPRKVVGMGASMSKPFQQALRNNFGGLQLRNEVLNNAPASSFNQVNPIVKPSSDVMTMSPYARMDSPAMNPFIPAYYTQQGGVSCGYGGRGLYTSYGKGLYGSN